MGIIDTNTSSKPVANFAKKEKVVVPASIAGEMRAVVPPLYYWEEVSGGVSVLMTMAFQIHGRTFGLSYPIEDENMVKIDMLRKKLFNVVSQSLDVLAHHGTKVLDGFGNIQPTLVNDQEAIRYRLDPHWDKKVAAFNQLCKIAPITKKQAIKLKLLEQPVV